MQVIPEVRPEQMETLVLLKYCMWNVKPEMLSDILEPNLSRMLCTLSLENHQDGVYLHSLGVSLSLQATKGGKRSMQGVQELWAYINRN